MATTKFKAGVYKITYMNDPNDYDIVELAEDVSKSTPIIAVTLIKTTDTDRDGEGKKVFFTNMIFNSKRVSKTVRP